MYELYFPQPIPMRKRSYTQHLYIQSLSVLRFIGVYTDQSPDELGAHAQQILKQEAGLVRIIIGNCNVKEGIIELKKKKKNVVYTLTTGYVFIQKCKGKKVCLLTFGNKFHGEICVSDSAQSQGDLNTPKTS